MPATTSPMGGGVGVNSDGKVGKDGKVNKEGGGKKCKEGKVYVGKGGRWVCKNGKWVKESTVDGGGGKKVDWTTHRPRRSSAPALLPAAPLFQALPPAVQ